jgi:hypothetical protein
MMGDGKYELDDSALDRLLAQASEPPELTGFAARLVARLEPGQTTGNVIAFRPRKAVISRPAARLKWPAVAALAACLAFGFFVGNSGFLVNLLGDGAMGSMVTADSDSSVDDIAKVIDGDQT